MIRNLCSLLLLIGLLAAQKVQAQDDPQYRLEIGAGVGTMAYEGDFNGSIFKNMQPMAAIVGRYNIDPYKDLRLNIGLGKIKGASGNVDSYFPDYAEQSYAFNHTLVDASFVFSITSGPTVQAGIIGEPNPWFRSSLVVWVPPMQREVKRMCLQPMYLWV